MCYFDIEVLNLGRHIVLVYISAQIVRYQKRNFNFMKQTQVKEHIAHIDPDVLLRVTVHLDNPLVF